MTHEDGYTLYWPTGPEPAAFNSNNPAYREQMKRISDHMIRMAGQDIPVSYGIAGRKTIYFLCLRDMFSLTNLSQFFLLYSTLFHNDPAAHRDHCGSLVPLHLQRCTNCHRSTTLFAADYEINSY